MKRFLATLALTCVLAGSALAGDIPTCGIAAQNPTIQPSSSGDSQSTDYASGLLAESGLVAVVLTFLIVP